MIALFTLFTIASADFFVKNIDGEPGKVYETGRCCNYVENGEQKSINTTTTQRKWSKQVFGGFNYDSNMEQMLKIQMKTIQEDLHLLKNDTYVSKYADDDSLHYFE